MNTVILNFVISSQPISVKVHRDEDYKKLKEILRDILTPIIGDQNWNKYIEIIRDTAIPHFR